MNSKTKTHSTSSVQACQNCKQDFVVEPEDFNFYEKIQVPPPTWCPDCRALRRLIWRNERSLYHNKCAFSGKNIISVFAPETKLTVYDRDIWWGDKWDPLAYGQEYDFSKPFFEQYKELLSKIPLPNVGNVNCTKSEYGNHNTDCKNCYLTYATFGGENISYSQGATYAKDSFDLYTVLKTEKCYEDVICTGLFNTHFSYDSDDSIDSKFLTSCLNVQSSLGCINLRHKTHHIFNEPYTKEDYEKEVKKYNFGSFNELNQFKEKYKKFLLNHPRRHSQILKSVNVTGDNVMTSKNSKMVFNIFGELEDSKYIVHAMNVKNCYDGYGLGLRSELMYECVDAGIDAYQEKFGIITHTCLNSNYTYLCFSSQNLFGCIGLRQQEYCILNKKYTKEEYEKLLPKIIEHMNAMPYVDQKGRVYKYGEFFPPEISPFAYNETIAHEYYPLDKDGAKKFGFRWKERAERNYEIEILPEDLLDHVRDADESLIGKVIGCAHKGECNEQCTEAFKIRAEDLEFYKRMNFALPRLCPNCRHFARLKQRNPFKLWHRQCMCDKKHPHHEGRCEVEFETSYAPDRPEIVYCEKCYQQEVY